MESDNLKRIEQLTNELVDRTRKEQRRYAILDVILETSTDGYWDWHIKDDYEYLSPKFKAQLGYQPEEMEMHPSAWQKLIHPDDMKTMFALVQSHFESGGEVPFTSVARFTHKAGHEVRILCRGQVIEWDGKEPIRMVGTHVLLEK